MIFGNEFKLPFRYGGLFGGHKDQRKGDPMMVFHTSITLKEKNIGVPLGDDTNGTWNIPFEITEEAITSCDACVEDGIAVNGIYVW